LVFPAAFLVFCIPLNFLDSLTFPLRLMVTVASTHFLNGIGIAVRRSGSAIYSAVEGGFQLDVADPCSGLRSIMALTALTAVYAYLTQRTLLKKWLLFMASIPLAIIGNIARVTTIALMAEAFGQEVATGLYHDYSGFIFFPVSLGLMILLGSFLNSDPKEVWFRWKHALLSPTSS
jgi:exosortase